jgi:sensor histidine kinase YesM
MALAKPTAAGIDWSTVFMLPPKRRFSAAELARAVPGPLSATLKVALALNLGLVALLFGWLGWRDGPGPLMAFMATFMVVTVAAGLAAWRNPSGAVARAAYWLIPISGGLVVGYLVARRTVDGRTAAGMAQMVAFAVLGLWFTIVHRHQYIEMRLAELDERERAVEMAQRLASAQLAPHFLFNTLASVQHWVATRDERAGPLLQSLTGYLRSTLPMFARALHPAADEIEAVRRYLEVMQARLGRERLAWSVEVQPSLLALPLPPGLLLTLVENAVEHGIEPQLAGGTLRLRAHHDGSAAVFEVQDNGPGLAAARGDGIGLANSRQRLALTHGEAARLQLDPAPGGGCRARVTLPTTP